jgi:hypothetical protein
MDLGTLKTITRALVGDQLDESQSWDNDEIVAAINFAVLTYCEKTDCSYKEESVSFTSGDGAMPADYIRMERVIASGVVLDWTDKDFEDRKNPSWRGLAGTPKRVMVKDGNTLRLVPYATMSVTVGFIEKPADLASDGDDVDPRIPEPHHPYLKYAAGAWLYMKDGDQQDMNKAQALMGTFNSLIGIESAKEPSETKE